jgi:hypothetical protein
MPRSFFDDIFDPLEGAGSFLKGALRTDTPYSGGLLRVVFSL